MSLFKALLKKKCHGVKQNEKKNVPLVKQNAIDKELIRRERRDGGEGEERGLRKGVERG